MCQIGEPNHEGTNSCTCRIVFVSTSKYASELSCEYNITKCGLLNTNANMENITGCMCTGIFKEREENFDYLSD